MTRAQAMERAVRDRLECTWLPGFGRDQCGQPKEHCCHHAMADALALPPDPDQSAEIARLAAQRDAWKAAALEGRNGYPANEFYRLIRVAENLEKKP